MNNLIVGSLFLTFASTGHAGDENITDKYCSAHADMASRIFEVRKVEGVSLDSVISQIEASGKNLSLSAKNFLKHAYTVPIKYNKKQVYDSAYKLCYSTYDGLIAKK